MPGRSSRGTRECSPRWVDRPLERHVRRAGTRFRADLASTSWKVTPANSGVTVWTSPARTSPPGPCRAAPRRRPRPPDPANARPLVEHAFYLVSDPSASSGPMSPRNSPVTASTAAPVVGANRSSNRSYRSYRRNCVLHGTLHLGDDQLDPPRGEEVVEFQQFVHRGRVDCGDGFGGKDDRVHVLAGILDDRADVVVEHAAVGEEQRRVETHDDDAGDPRGLGVAATSW